MLKIPCSSPAIIREDTNSLLENIHHCENALHKYKNMWVILGFSAWLDIEMYKVRDTYGFNKRAKVLC